MSSGLREALQYYIRYEDYSRFMNSSLNSEEGEQLHENVLEHSSLLKETIEKKEIDAIQSKLESYPEFKNLSIKEKKDRSKWKALIQSIISKEIDVEEFIKKTPLSYPDNISNFKSYISQLINHDVVTICYPLMIKRLSANKKPLIRPVITFKCELTEEGLFTNSFVLNRESLEVMLAEAESCPVEDVRLIAARKYQDIVTAIDSIESSDISQIISLIDQCIKEHIPNWSMKSLLDFREYYGWVMTRRIFITKDELKEIKESIFRKELERLVERQAIHSAPLLSNYVFGNQQALDYQFKPEPSGREYHYGSYTAEYPVNIKQWRIIQSLEHAKLLAVNGPPGTGKTTLIKEMIADYMVRKARLLIEKWDQPWELVDEGQKREHYRSPFGGRNPYSIVITSTNNKAVDNIGIELSEEVDLFTSLSLLSVEGDFPLDEFLDDEIGEYVGDDEALENPTGFISLSQDNVKSVASGFFCARLGNMSNMNEFRHKIFNRLQKGLKHSQIESLKNEAVRAHFKNSMDELDDLQQNIIKFWDLLQHCLSTAILDDNRDLNLSITKCSNEIERIALELEESTIALELLRKHKGIKEEEFKEIEDEHRIRKEEKEVATDNLRQAYDDKQLLTNWSKFPNSLFFLLPKRKRFKKINPSLDFIQEIRIQPLQQEIEKCNSVIDDYKQNHPTLQIEISSTSEKMNETNQKIDELETVITKLNDRLSSLQSLSQQESELIKRLQLPSVIKFSYYELTNTPIVVNHRKHLFELALKVNEQYIIEHRKEIIFNLEKMGEQQRWFQAFYSEKGKRLDNYQEGIKAIWETFFLCFPVATTTLHSFSENLFQQLPELIDTLFVDEAGQIMPHYLCAPLFRARKAVVVGDPEQLEPVRPFTMNLIEESKVDEHLHDKICVLKNNAQDYADRGGDFFEYMGNKKKGVILDEHRRCESNIMKFSNFHVYNEMLHLTKADNLDKLFGANLVAFDIRGLKDQYAHRNRSEIRACQRIVEMLVEKYGVDIRNNIGIITPFSAQARELASAITGIEIGTVHTFQGKEKRFILFSSVVDGIHAKNLGLSYVIGNKPNMLNVAFSRAKEQFIFVGNLETGLASANYLELAIQAIQKNGLIYSLFNEEYEQGVTDSMRNVAYAIYRDEIGISDVDSRFIEVINSELNNNVLLNPKKHHGLMTKALEYCRESLGIVSPWTSSTVMNASFFTLLKAAQDRKVDIRVRFGYQKTKFTIDDIDKIVERDNYSFSNKDATKTALKELRGIIGQGLAYTPPLHTKVMLIDNKILFIGSHNWLSNTGRQAREEISYLITDKQAIEYVKVKFGL
ncbi:hypothetical protein HQN90_27370 [Paenibacillus alba]|uniref:AAA domain-containing protein n=1 Tax=Paenibacillus alba TaxID=1197127 RepID=UPI001562FA71|nr:AAA domain-containing protein [Paenibacillus alba]NQX69859.1 hypothetical protein [Paenibacillus alba]